MLFMPHHYFSDLNSIPDSFFIDNSIKAVVCDIDNTLIRYDESTPSDYSLCFMNRLKALGIRLFLLSNNNDRSRSEMFPRELVDKASHNAKKPVFSKKMILKMLESEGISQENALLIGDQVFTDILAGKLSGIRTLLVEPLGPSMIPLFGIKRWFEKPIKQSFIKKHGINK